MIDISIIIMAYNEELAVTGVLRELDEEMARSPFTYEIVLVDDGSTDRTESCARSYAQAAAHMRVISHPVNRGIGEVYRTGFGAAQGRLISFLPADGQFPARLIREFASLMASHDLVMGYIPQHKRSIAGSLLSRVERLLYAVLFGRLPPFQGILMFKNGAIESLGVQVGGRGWQMLMDLVVRAQRAGYRMTSVPHELRERTAGASKVTNLRHVWANLRQALAIRWRLWLRPVRRGSAEFRLT